MTLNGRNVTLAEIKSFYGAHHKNFNKDRPKLSPAKFRSMILVSKNIRYVRIFAGVPREVASNDSVVVEERNFHCLLLIIAGVPLQRIYRICIQHAVPRRLFGDFQMNDIG